MQIRPDYPILEPAVVYYRFMHNPISWRSDSLHQKWLSCGKSPQSVKGLLLASGSLDFPTYQSGMTPASVLPGDIGNRTGMGYAWIRDNAHAANSLLENGDIPKASGIVRAILEIFKNNQSKIDDIISGAVSPSEVMNRLPVRVEGDTLAATGQWPNAQNDSIGYALWIVSRAVLAGAVELGDDDRLIIDKLIAYLGAIAYWQDEDSGHWEEDRKLHASSIGVVVAGLESLKQNNRLNVSDVTSLEDLIAKGRLALDHLIADDCPLDASLIFLVEPLGVVGSEQAAKIVRMIETNLLRDYGVVRYPDDSYWAADYRDHFSLGDRTADFSDRLDERARHNIPEHEAQWTLFDPILAIYHHSLYKKSHEIFHRQAAGYFLERSLASFIDAGSSWRIPEAFFFEHGAWVENDHVPLLWSQANVLLALNRMS